MGVSEAAGPLCNAHFTLAGTGVHTGEGWESRCTPPPPASPLRRFLNEDDVETFMIRQLDDPAHEAHEDFKRKTRRVARLPTEQLVGALNEHVSGGGRLAMALAAILIPCMCVLAGTCGSTVGSLWPDQLAAWRLPAVDGAAAGQRGLPLQKLHKGAAPL